MLETLYNLLQRLHGDPYEAIAIVVELLLIGLSVNWCAGVLSGTRGTRPLRGLLTVLVIATLVIRILTVQLDWTRLELLYRYFLYGMAFVALVAFQPELRRAVIRVGDVRFGRRGLPQSKLIVGLVKSAGYLSRNKYGALIAIQRNVDLQGWADNGTIINAEVSANLLNSIFYPKSPLHDLGVIIRDARIVAANCQFPSADSDEADSALGSRHLAALGMSYETDALVLVVSEETGTISLADNGKLHRFLSLDDLASELTTRLDARDRGNERRLARTLGGPAVWRAARRAAFVVPITLIVWYLTDQATQIQAEGVAVELLVRPSPEMVVDIVEPASRSFSVTFRGSTRAIETLRSEAAGKPLKVEWTLPETFTGPQQYALPADDVLERLPAIQQRGVSVQKAIPPTIMLAIDDVVTFNAPVRPAAGTARLADVRVEPAEVLVAMRRGDRERLTEDQLFVEVRLEDRLRDLPAEKPLSLTDLPVEKAIGGFKMLRVDPPEVAVSLRVVEQRLRRSLSGIVAQLTASPQIWQRYDVVLNDQSELRIELEVEGDKSAVDALRPQDVRALVPVTSDLLVTAPEFRSVEVTLLLPPGVAVVGPPRTVLLRLQERQTAAP